MKKNEFIPLPSERDENSVENRTLSFLTTLAAMGGANLAAAILVFIGSVGLHILGIFTPDYGYLLSVLLLSMAAISIVVVIIKSFTNR